MRWVQPNSFPSPDQKQQGDKLGDAGQGTRHLPSTAGVGQKRPPLRQRLNPSQPLLQAFPPPPAPYYASAHGAPAHPQHPLYPPHCSAVTGQSFHRTQDSSASLEAAPKAPLSCPTPMPHSHGRHSSQHLLALGTLRFVSLN